MKKQIKNISWPFLILFSIIIGIVVGIFNRIPILRNTSFQDIAIYLEMWIIFAIYIIYNCKSLKDAVIKCFIFFLISQPIIYLTEIAIDTFFYNKEFLNNLILYFRNYYFGAGWFFMTILTIPGAIIAYQIKRDNLLSAIVLSVATSYLAFSGSNGILKTLFYNFPYHLLNNLICLFMAYYLIFKILKVKKYRLFAITITTIFTLLGVCYFIFNNSKPTLKYTLVDFPDNVQITSYEIDNKNIVDLELSDDGTWMNVYTTKEFGKTQIRVYDNNFKVYIYQVETDHLQFNINLE